VGPIANFAYLAEISVVFVKGEVISNHAEFFHFIVQVKNFEEVLE
jgi:hypothetical protein